MCPLYPGMTCREHCDAAVDIETERDDELTTVPFIVLCPNSWLVPPHGAPERVAEKDQFVAKKIIEQAKAMQKRLGPALPRKAFDQIHNAFTQAEAASDNDDYNKALQAYAGIQTLTKEAPPSLQKLIDARLADLEESARFEFEDLIEVGPRDKMPMAERIAKIRNLMKAVDVGVFGKKIPLVADIKTWLEKSAGKK